MTRKPRYTLLILGILFFAVAAPVLVLYVQGKLPLPGNRRIQPTGIISVTSDPSGAEVYVNNKLEDTTPASIRFVPTGDYDIRIYKNGYWEWHKKLPVVAGRVTYANPNPDKQILLKRETPQELAGQVSMYAPYGKGLVYVSGLTLTRIPNLDEPDRSTHTSLPETPLELITNPDSAYIGIRTAHSLFLLNPNGFVFTDITKPLPAVAKLTLTETLALALTPDHTLLALSLEKPASKPLTLASNVYAFRVRQSDIYYIQKETETGDLHHATVSTGGLTNDQLLTKNIPTQEPQLYIDSTKAVFVLSNRTLYRVNAQPEVVASQVAASSDVTGTLSYTTAGELWWYDSGHNTGRLVSRSGEGFAENIIQPSLQYALFTQGKQLIALELDDRGEQNRYVLDTANSITHLEYLNSTTLAYIADTALHILTLR
jgi:hypothetical protein